MADVKRSVVISQEQDRFLEQLRRRFGFNRSHGVRIALEKLMRDPPFFVTTDLANSKESAHCEQTQEASR